MKKNKSGLTAKQKKAAGLPADWKPSAEVFVYDTEFEAGQAIERLRAGDQEAWFDLVPLINKGSDRNRIERKTLGRANQDSKQTANKKKKAALNIAARLMRERRELRLSRRKSELARAVWERLPTIERSTERTIRRWLTEWFKPQK